MPLLRQSQLRRVLFGGPIRRQRGIRQMKRVIHLKLTRAEAEALLDAGNRGVSDLHDAGDDESLAAADWADAALDKLGRAMAEANWVGDFEFPAR